MADDKIEDASSDLTFSFAAPEVTAAFQVNPGRREITGLIVPWEQVAWSDGSQWRFARGSIATPRDPSRIKLLRDHDPKQAVGKAIAFEDQMDGLHATFKIMRGAKGDEVLSEAEDGVLDGFSVGPKIADWSRHSGDPSVRYVRDSSLVETSITALPSFGDARVRSIAASRANAQHSNKGSEMPEEQNQGQGQNKGQGSNGGEGGAITLTNPDAAMKAFEKSIDERFDKVTDKLTESFGAVTTKLTETHEKIVSDALAKSYAQMEGPAAAADAEFSAARVKVTSEPPVYRFEGGARGHSLVRDFWRAQTERDYDAVERLRKFQEQQRDMVNLLQRMPPSARATFANPTFDVNRTSGAPVIPPGYRPDLFVNELRRGRPIVANLSNGTITDATPFTVPRFVSSTTATADHVEGTNPAEGSMVLESVTVTPGAVSGRFDLTREIVDAANPAIDAIALATMRESYNRQTEQKAYAELNIDANVAVFNTADLSDLAGATPAVARRKVVTDLRDLLARYPFTRFAAPTGGIMGQLVTSALANAVGTDERPLLPSVGAQNAYGLGDAVDQGWSIDGLVMRPAWAVTQNAGDEVALIINRSDVWAWESPLLTFRFEEKQGPAVIELALFAYFATKVLRPAGIFSLRAVV